MRVGLVGCGRIAHTHLRVLRSIEGIDIVGVADPRFEVRTAFAARYGIEFHTDELSALLQQARPDVVHVLTPADRTADLAAMALESGVGAFVEKPMGCNPEEAERLHTLAQGRIFGVNHSRLYHPAVTRAVRLISEGRIGNLMGVEIRQGFTPESAESGPTAPWSYRYPGGIIDNLLPHCLYYANHFVGQGDDLRVTASARRQRPGSLGDEINCWWEGKRGFARIVLSLSTAPERNLVVLLGARGTIVVDTNQVLTMVVQDRALPSFARKAFATLDPGMQLIAATFRNALAVLMGRLKSYPDFDASIRAFYASLRGGPEYLGGPHEGRVVAQQLDFVKSRLRELPVASARVVAKPGSDRGSVLLAGSRGLIGRHVRVALMENGYRVLRVVREPGEHGPELDPDDVVLDGESLRGVRELPEGILALVNCSGVLQGHSLDDFRRGNVDLPVALARAASRLGVAYTIHLSSMGVYGVPPDGCLTETSPLEPFPERRGFYTQSKVEGDAALAEEARGLGTRLLLLRPGVVYGHGRALPLGKLPLKRLGGLQFLGGGRGLAFPVTYAGTIAEAVVSALESRPEGVLNLVEEPCPTQGQFSDLARRVDPGLPRAVFMPMIILRGLMGSLDLMTRSRGRESNLAYRLERTLAGFTVDGGRVEACLGGLKRLDLEKTLEKTLGA